MRLHPYCICRYEIVEDIRYLMVQPDCETHGFLGFDVSRFPMKLGSNYLTRFATDVYAPE